MFPVVSETEWQWILNLMFVNNTQFYRNWRHILNCQKKLGRPQPQTIIAGARGHCGQKIIRWKYRQTRRKFCVLQFCASHYSLSIFFLGNIRTPWGNAPNLVPFSITFIVDERCWAYQSYALLIDGGSAKFDVFPSTHFRGGVKIFLKVGFKAWPPHQTCVQILWWPVKRRLRSTV